jgi:L-xylulose reductase
MAAPITDFNHRPVLVTGATGGIGSETVRQLVATGADVIASGRSEEALTALAQETGVRTLPFDLASEESVRNALDGVDVYGVVNCGGFGGEIATPMDTDIAVFDKVIAINTRGALQVHLTVDDSARSGWVNRQCLKSGEPGGAAGAHFVRGLQGCP